MKSIFLRLRGIIALIVLLPIMVAGYVIYIATKPVRALAFLMMNYKHSAKDELRGFFSTTHSFGDL